MSQIHGAFWLLICYFIFALLVLWVDPYFLNYPDISKVCSVARLSLGVCQREAMAVAAYSTATLAMALLISTALNRASTTQTSKEFPLDDVAARSLLLLFLFGVSIVLVAHILERSSASLPYDVRIPPREGAFISLENLCWPILLQLLFWTKDGALRPIIVSFLIMIVALSPFRAVLFAVVYFGAVIPLSSWLLTNPLRTRRAVWLTGSALTLTVTILALAIAFQTQTRIERSAWSNAGSRQPAALFNALISRGLSPLFQAELVAQVVETEPAAVPTFVQTVAAKFRLSSRPNLNEYIYSMLYQSEGEGQTTSLFFGEAVANSAAWPVYWMFSAPLFLVLLYVFTRSYADVGILVAIALWRGAMGGLFDVLPALILQLGFCISLAWSARAKRRGW
jgi:hypothetical protein